MNLTIHVETTQTEQPLVYQGDSAGAALEFIRSVKDEPNVVQCNFVTEVNGEKRALARVAKGPDCTALLTDAVCWLTEVDPSICDKKEIEE